MRLAGIWLPGNAATGRRDRSTMPRSPRNRRHASRREALSRTDRTGSCPDSRCRSATKLVRRRAVVECGIFNGPPIVPPNDWCVVRRVGRRRVAPQLVRPAVERRPAERIVRRGEEAILLDAAAAEKAAATPGETSRTAAAARAASAETTWATAAPGLFASPAPNCAFVVSPVTGSISPRPMAPNRSFIKPRSRLAAFPLIAMASAGVSVEKPGGKSKRVEVSASVDVDSAADAPRACTSTLWNDD